MRRKWLPPLVFLHGELLRQSKLMGYSPWGLKESDMTEFTSKQVNGIIKWMRILGGYV